MNKYHGTTYQGLLLFAERLGGVTLYRTWRGACICISIGIILKQVVVVVCVNAKKYESQNKRVKKAKKGTSR